MENRLRQFRRGCACRSNLARHREQRLARGARVFHKTHFKGTRTGFLKKLFQVFGNNRRRAARDRSPRSRRRYGMVDGRRIVVVRAPKRSSSLTGVFGR
jgi:hypothetical protein